MAKKKSTEMVSSDETLAAVNQPPEMLALLEFYDRKMNLDIVGTRTMQVTVDPTELGVREVKLDLPGFKVRIML